MERKKGDSNESILPSKFPSKLFILEVMVIVT
jgi:hypothetical protein